MDCAGKCADVTDTPLHTYMPPTRQPPAPHAGAGAQAQVGHRGCSHAAPRHSAAPLLADPRRLHPWGCAVPWGAPGGGGRHRAGLAVAHPGGAPAAAAAAGTTPAAPAACDGGGSSSRSIPSTIAAQATCTLRQCLYAITSTLQLFASTFISFDPLLVFSRPCSFRILAMPVSLGHATTHACGSVVTASGTMAVRSDTHLAAGAEVGIAQK